MTCPICKQETPQCELVNYNGRCENCWADSPYQPPADPRYHRSKTGRADAALTGIRRSKEDKK